jgi:hypothetical protein
MSTFIQNNFGVTVTSQGMPAEKIIYKNKVSFKLQKNSVYSLHITNNNNVKADVYISLNDKNIGVWRVNPYSKITVNNNQDFILTHDNTDFKLIFKPEKFTTYNPLANQIQSCENSSMYCKRYTDSFVAFDQMDRPCLMSTNKYDEYIANTLAPSLLKKQPIQEKIVSPLEDIDISHIETIEFSLMMIGTIYLENPSFKNIKYTSRYVYS